jgi:SAM-dependent methyltransferase
MIKNFYDSEFAQTIFYQAIGVLVLGVNNYLSFLRIESKPMETSPAGWYERIGRSRLPIFDGYRYSIKPCWRFFWGLNALAELQSSGLATRHEREFLVRARGSRTLAVTVPEIEQMSARAVERHPERFFRSAVGEGFSPLPIPNDAAIKAELAKWQRIHRVTFRKLKAFGIDASPKTHPKILEIGFIGGGYAAFAFRQMGFKVEAIDYFYGSLAGHAPLPNHIARVINSDVRFAAGDITRQTEFKSESFDIIDSASVLEHINDLEAGFHEMHRLLRPGGLMIHQYNPFYCANGGHALAILDCPWGHVRLTRDELRSYIEAHRPYEAEIAHKWIDHDLNYLPIRDVQRLLVKAGFEIRFWQQHGSPKRHLKYLSSEVISECLDANPGIALDDLVTGNISFVAIKTD